MQQGCYKYAIDVIGIPNLAALPKSERENKAQCYEERLSMLSLAAIRDFEGKFDLHYRLHKVYPVCRAAYMYFFAIPNTTLNTAVTSLSFPFLLFPFLSFPSLSLISEHDRVDFGPLHMSGRVNFGPLADLGRVDFGPFHI